MWEEVVYTPVSTFTAINVKNTQTKSPNRWIVPGSYSAVEGTLLH